jgi:hypothetical protein
VTGSEREICHFPIKTGKRKKAQILTFKPNLEEADLSRKYPIAFRHLKLRFGNRKKLINIVYACDSDDEE